LSSILHEIGASKCLAAIVEDYDDDALKTLSKLKPERIASKFGMAVDKAILFVSKCLEASASHGATGEGAAMSSSSPSPSASAPSVASASPAGDAAIMRALHLEMIRELGKCGFGTVYEAKNLADRLKVAVKIVKDPLNAIQAIREGQRLRRVKHKNIVCMNRVHDLGGGVCALEMEVVTGGDMFQHLEACRRRPDSRLPHHAVLRLSRQLLDAASSVASSMQRWAKSRNESACPGLGFRV
jgi:hypothetical protein